ncbi:four helix bundle protein [candidate division KSB1 bacterium]|nr:four helix bundle protein [candidate division KSB1 bacterium]
MLEIQVAKFRFQDLEVWKMSMNIVSQLLEIADELENRKLFRFAEQLRGAAMSISNNIAEGSGSNSDKEFSYFLNITRRSTFENANILILLHTRKLIPDTILNELLRELDYLCRKITNLQKTLNYK